MRSTGVGSLPGTDVREVANIVAGEVDGLIHQVELPHRGPGADLIGRTAGQLLATTGDFALDTTPDGWRLTDATNRTMRRAQSWWQEDADAMELSAQDFSGDVKVQLCGPWTLAAHIELRTGERMLRDRGACRDVSEALAMTAAAIIRQTQRRIPGAKSVYVQFDEPQLAAVAAGGLRTASGYGRYAPMPSADLEHALAVVLGAVTDADGLPGVHACAVGTPWDVVMKSGAAFVSFDALTAPIPDDVLGAMWEGGTGLFFGSVPAVDQGRAWTPTQVTAPIRSAGARLGLDRFANVVVTPTCGMAGASLAWVRTAYAACKDAARLLRGESSDEAS